MTSIMSILFALASLSAVLAHGASSLTLSSPATSATLGPARFTPSLRAAFPAAQLKPSLPTSDRHAASFVISPPKYPSLKANAMAKNGLPSEIKPTTVSKNDNLAESFLDQDPVSVKLKDEDLAKFGDMLGAVDIRAYPEGDNQLPDLEKMEWATPRSILDLWPIPSSLNVYLTESSRKSCTVPSSQFVKFKSFIGSATIDFTKTNPNSDAIKFELKRILDTFSIMVEKHRPFFSGINIVLLEATPAPEQPDFHEHFAKALDSIQLEGSFIDHLIVDAGSPTYSF